MQEYLQLNPPIYRASTILFDNTDNFLARSQNLFDGYTYGLSGTPTIRRLEEEVAGIEGGTRSIVVQSGLAAITHALLGLCKASDHVLVADCSYGPNRAFCKRTLRRYGVEVEFFPSSAGSIAAQLRSDTRLVVLESPGYYTMEIQEIRNIAQEAHGVGALVAIDNSWGFGASEMFTHGVDISCVALSKYASAGGDLCLGSMTFTDEALFRELKRFMGELGSGASSDEAYLVLRSLPSLRVRVEAHEERSLSVARMLLDHPTVARVLHPALVDNDQHDRFVRYFRRSNGLFSVVFKDASLDALRRMIDGFRHFRIGASWGSSHSLVSIARPAESRDVDRWPADEHIVRFHLGLEDLELLVEDIERGLERLAAA